MEVISVITPVYNRKEYISECVESVACSQVKEGVLIEHLVIDDGSTDGTWEELVELRENYPNLKTIKMEKNLGPAAARNLGISNALGEYLFFLDSDDLLFQTSLANLYEYLRESEVGWVYGGFVRGDGKGEYLIGKDYWGSQFESAEDLLIAMYSAKHFFQHSFMVRKELVNRVGGYDESLRMAEDFDLCTRFLLAGEYPKYLPGALYMHRDHGNNLSADHVWDPKKHLQDVKMLKEKYVGRFSQKVLSEIL